MLDLTDSECEDKNCRCWKNPTNGNNNEPNPQKKKNNRGKKPKKGTGLSERARKASEQQISETFLQPPEKAQKVNQPVDLQSVPDQTNLNSTDEERGRTKQRRIQSRSDSPSPPPEPVSIPAIKELLTQYQEQQARKSATKDPNLTDNNTTPSNKKTNKRKKRSETSLNNQTPENNSSDNNNHNTSLLQPTSDQSNSDKPNNQHPNCDQPNNDDSNSQQSNSDQPNSQPTIQHPTKQQIQIGKWLRKQSTPEQRELQRWVDDLDPHIRQRILKVQTPKVILLWYKTNLLLRTRRSAGQT